MTSYRDILARRGIMPARIERTVPRDGDKILDSWARPVRIHGNEFVNQKGEVSASPGKAGMAMRKWDKKS